MKIEGTKLQTDNKVAKTKKKKTSSIFSLGEDESTTTETESTKEGTSINSIDPSTLLSIQTVNANEDRKYQIYTIDKGKEALKELSNLQREILSGNINPSRLLQIDKEISQISAIKDPKLKGIMEFIKQRVKIELAKLGLV